MTQLRWVFPPHFSSSPSAPVSFSVYVVAFFQPVLLPPWSGSCSGQLLWYPIILAAYYLLFPGLDDEHTMHSSDFTSAMTFPGSLRWFRQRRHLSSHHGRWPSKAPRGRRLSDPSFPLYYVQLLISQDPSLSIFDEPVALQSRVQHLAVSVTILTDFYSIL